MNSESEMFYIQNTGYVGNSLKFWRPDGAGYTTYLDEAWKVPKEKALDICRSRPDQDIPIPAELVEAAATRQVCCERLRAAQRQMTANLDSGGARA